MSIKNLLSESNPVGEVQQLKAVDEKVSNFVKLWEADHPVPKWWQFWKKGTALYKIVKFLMNALDEFITLVEDVIEKGADKKATVIAAIGSLYDYIIKETMPIWLRPFANKVRYVVIEVLIASAIDWIVEKYRSGAWEQKPTEETLEEAPEDLTEEADGTKVQTEKETEA